MAPFYFPRHQTRDSFLRSEIETIEEWCLDARRIIAEGPPPISNVRARAKYVEAVETLANAEQSLTVLRSAISRYGAEVR